MQEISKSGLPSEVMQAIAAGRKIEAIKLLRESEGIGLREAKAAVDALARGGNKMTHRAAPSDDTGMGRLALVCVVLGAVVAGYLWTAG